MLPEDFELRSRFGQGLDWPLKYKDLEPYYRKAEYELGVSGDVEDQDYGGLDFGAGYVLPMHKMPLSYLDKTLARDLDGTEVVLDGQTFSLRVRSTPQARNGIPNTRYDSGKGYRPTGAVSIDQAEVGHRCQGNTNCVPICPVQAKYDARRTLFKALDTGRVDLLPQTVASRVHIDPASGRVTAIEYKSYHDPQSREHVTGTVRGKLFVLAANAVENARLMLASNLHGSSDLVGRNLMDHAFLLTWALMPEVVGALRGPLCTSGIEDLRTGSFRRRHAAFRYSIHNDGWGWATASPYTDLDLLVDRQNKFGRALREGLVQQISRQVLIDSMVEVPPDLSNRVSVDPAYCDQLGNPRPVISFGIPTYTLEAIACRASRVEADLSEGRSRRSHALRTDHVWLDQLSGRRLRHSRWQPLGRHASDGCERARIGCRCATALVGSRESISRRRRQHADRRNVEHDADDRRPVLPHGRTHRQSARQTVGSHRKCRMSLYRITDIDELRRHLHAAVQLEHATIPPYLTALYSIRPGTNPDAYHVLRVVAVEEMLHLTLAANMLNAVGGCPDLTTHGFVPDYPAYLPNGETDFQADLRPFSREAIDSFLKIERPALPPPAESVSGAEPSAVAASADSAHHGQHRRHAAHTVHRSRRRRSVRAAHVHDDSEEHFYSIGEFYKAIEQGLTLLHEQQGDALFSGDPRLQVTSDYYYSGGGELFPVTDLASAKQAMRLISEQGEGIGGGIFDYEAELGHYYRFEQLIQGRYYRDNDTPGNPTGSTVGVDWDAVYPIKANAKLSDYPKGSDVYRAAEAFNSRYAAFLQMLTRAFRGEPELLIEAVGEMFVLKELAYRLTRQPIDGPGTPHAAPTFEMPG